jgi:lipoprotein NlpD
VQREAGITYKNMKDSGMYKPSYLRGGYVSDKKGGVVRDLKLEEETKEEVESIREVEEESDIIEEKKAVNKYDDRITQIVVQKGDTLLKYQRQYGVSVEEIAKMNNIKKPYNIYVGQKVKIRETLSNRENVEKKAKKYKVIRVESGDNLLGLSLKYSSNVRELAEINDIPAPYNIYAGQKLKVPDNGKAEKTFNHGKDNDVYTVERGDSLLLIAKKTNTKFDNLIKINNLKRPYNIYVGQKIYLSNSKPSSRPQRGKVVVAGQEKEENVGVISDTKTSKLNDNVTVKNINNEFSKPLEGDIVRNFGDNVGGGKFFDGIVIKGNKGDAVRVADDGEVVYAGNELKDLGNIIIVKHKNNWLSIYGYCDTTNVKVKDAVKRGDVIASVGKTGSATGYQLYFAIRRGKVAVDPVKYLSKN